MGGWATSGTFAALTARSGLRRVLLAYAVLGFVEFYVWLVVILWAYDVGGAGLAGTAAVAQVLPAALLAPGIAGLGDRLPRGRALALAYAGIAATAGLVWLALSASAPVAVVLAASTLTTTMVAVARPIHFAALPQLAAASPAQLVSANSLSSVLDGITRFSGTVAAGAVVAGSGPVTGMAVGALVAVAPAVLCLGLGLDPGAGRDDEEGGLRAALAGVRVLRGDWAVLALLTVMSLDFVLSGALDVLGVAWADEVLGDGEVAAGLVIGAMGIGGLLGALAGSAATGGRRIARIVLAGAVIEGAIFAVLAVVGLLVPAMVLLAIAGFGGAVTLVAGRTLLQRTTDDRVLARVFAVQESVSLLGIAIGAAVVPWLIDSVGARGTWVPFGVMALLVTVLCWRAVSRLDARATYLPAELALLREVPFIAALPAYDVERLARRGYWRDVAAGEPVVVQGEQGDEFYLVGVGRVSVTIDGVTKPGLLEPGSYFGEIALLRSIPRTATVAAVEPTRMFVVRAADFLAAVTGGADGAAVAYEVSQRYEDLSR